MDDLCVYIYILYIYIPGQSPPKRIVFRFHFFILRSWVSQDPNRVCKIMTRIEGSKFMTQISWDIRAVFNTVYIYTCTWKAKERPILGVKLPKQNRTQKAFQVYIFVYIHIIYLKNRRVLVNLNPHPFPSLSGMPKALPRYNTLPTGCGGSSEDDWIPWLKTMVIVSPLTLVVSFPNGLFMASKLVGYKLLTKWDDPPRIGSMGFSYISRLCPTEGSDS